MENTIIAVYGTLKEGHGNYHRLLTSSKQIAKNAKTEEQFAMYSSGIPYVVKDEKKTQIVVELYEVDDSTLKRIDRLEGHPNWYKRELTPVIITEDDGTENKINAWIYFMGMSDADKARPSMKFHSDGKY